MLFVVIWTGTWWWCWMAVCVFMLSCEVVCTSVCSFAWLLIHSRPCRLTVHRAVQHHSAGWLLQCPESSGLRPQPWQKATTCQSEAPRWYVGGFGGQHFFHLLLSKDTTPELFMLKMALVMALWQFFIINRWEKKLGSLSPLHLHSVSPYKYYLFMLIPS